MTKTELLQQLRSHQRQRDAYLAAVPRDLRQAVYDNEFCGSLEASNDLLTAAAFGDAYEDVQWFLYEMRPGYSITEADGSQHVFNSDADFYIYFRKAVIECQ